MAETDALAQRFEAGRGRLRAVAYRLLGSLTEADDALQEAWLHASRAGAGGVGNVDGWLTQIVARVCLDMLRTRRARREEPLDSHVPDPVLSRMDGTDPESEALLAEQVGLALLVVLDRLGPAERVAFVLHDVFAVPFEEIAQIVGRSPEVVRQRASRARKRVSGAPAVPDADLPHQREVVDAFFAAVRSGDLGAVMAVLDPDVVVRADFGSAVGGAGASRVVRGAAAVAAETQKFARFAGTGTPAIVNGAAGIYAASGGRLHSVMAFTVRGGRIVEIDILGDPERLRGIDVASLEEVR